MLLLCVITEEILHSNSAHWWSPLATKICYAVFDDTNVPLYKFPRYGRGENIYGTIDEIAYPKVRHWLNIHAQQRHSTMKSHNFVYVIFLSRLITAWVTTAE